MLVLHCLSKSSIVCVNPSLSLYILHCLCTSFIVLVNPSFSCKLHGYRKVGTPHIGPYPCCSSLALAALPSLLLPCPADKSCNWPVVMRSLLAVAQQQGSATSGGSLAALGEEGAAAGAAGGGASEAPRPSSMASVHSVTSSTAGAKYLDLSLGGQAAATPSAPAPGQAGGSAAAAPSGVKALQPGWSM